MIMKKQKEKLTATTILHVDDFIADILENSVNKILQGKGTTADFLQVESACKVVLQNAKENLL